MLKRIGAKRNESPRRIGQTVSSRNDAVLNAGHFRKNDEVNIIRKWRSYENADFERRDDGDERRVVQRHVETNASRRRRKRKRAFGFSVAPANRLYEVGGIFYLIRFVVVFASSIFRSTAQERRVRREEQCGRCAVGERRLHFGRPHDRISRVVKTTAAVPCRQVASVGPFESVYI